ACRPLGTRTGRPTCPCSRRACASCRPGRAGRSRGLACRSCRWGLSLGVVSLFGRTAGFFGEVRTRGGSPAVVGFALQMKAVAGDFRGKDSVGVGVERPQVDDGEVAAGGERLETFVVLAGAGVE